MEQLYRGTRREPGVFKPIEPERLAGLTDVDLEIRTRAVEKRVDIISDPQRQDNEGFNWTRLRLARTVTDVVPGSTVVIGSAIGRYLAKVIAWDFEVSAEDPIVTLELLPVTPETVSCRQP